MLAVKSWCSFLKSWQRIVNIFLLDAVKLLEVNCERNVDVA